MNQLGFSLAIQAAPFGPFSREASRQSHLQALLDKSLLDANHRAATDGEGLGNLPIGVPADHSSVERGRPDSAWLESGSCEPSSPAMDVAPHSISRDSGSERFSCLHSLLRLHTLPVKPRRGEKTILFPG